jgi:putative transposase
MDSTRCDGLVARAADWPWSSYAHNAGLRHDRISPHAPSGLWATRRLPARPPMSCWKRVDHSQSAAGHAALRGWALGSRICAKFATKTERRSSKARPGRHASSGRKLKSYSVPLQANCRRI